MSQKEGYLRGPNDGHYSTYHPEVFYTGTGLRTVDTYTGIDPFPTYTLTQFIELYFQVGPNKST